MGDLRAIRVICVGLQARVRESVVAALPESLVLDCEVHEEALLEMCRGEGPTVVIVEGECLLRNGAEPMQRLSRFPLVEVLVVVEEEGDGVLEAALVAGCAGVLLFTAAEDVYRRALAAVVAGELWFPRAILSRLTRESLSSEPRQRLTGRELEILQLLAEDKKNQVIADALFISRETVRWHLRTLYSKLGVTNRAAAQEYARKTPLPMLRIRH